MMTVETRAIEIYCPTVPFPGVYIQHSIYSTIPASSQLYTILWCDSRIYSYICTVNCKKRSAEDQLLNMQYAGWTLDHSSGYLSHLIQYTAYLKYWTVHRLNTVWILLQYVHYIFKMLNRTPSESQYNQLIIFPTFSAYPFLLQYLFYAYIQCIHTTYPLLSILYNYLCASTLWEDAIKKMFSASKRKK